MNQAPGPNGITTPTKVSTIGRHAASGGVAICGYWIAKALLSPHLFSNLDPNEASLAREAIAATAGSGFASVVALGGALSRAGLARIGVALCAFSVVSLPFLGCAQIGTVSAFVHENPDSTKILAQYATLKLIEQSDSVSAEKVLAVVDGLDAFVSEDGEAFPAAELFARIPIDNLSQADQYAVRALVQLFLTEVRTRLPEGDAIPVEDVRTFLSWVREAADLAR